MVAVALVTGCSRVAVGPAAGVAMRDGAGVGRVSGRDGGQAVVLAAWLGLLVAIILLLGSWLRLGGMAEFLSSPVMLGFMNGAAVVIIISQIGKLCGITLEQDESLPRVLEWA